MLGTVYELIYNMMAPQRHHVLVTTVCDDDIKWIYLSHTWLKGKKTKTKISYRYVMFYLLTTALN